jgi:hypothetical protein
VWKLLWALVGRLPSHRCHALLRADSTFSELRQGEVRRILVLEVCEEAIEGPVGAVVATALGSANADYDNGATIPRPPRPGRRTGGEGHRVRHGTGEAAG